jgi:hypothetical protein
MRADALRRGTLGLIAAASVAGLHLGAGLPTSDYDDWATTGSTTTDPLDAVVPTKVSTALSRTDLQVLDSIGFTVT